MFNLDDLRSLMDIPFDVPEDERPEDLQIISLTDPNYRACINYELADRGYRLLDEELNYVGSRL